GQKDRKAFVPWRFPYAAVAPPSTTNSPPVVNDASSLARNRMVRATSSASPMRPRGDAALRAARIFSGSRALAIVFCTIGVSAKDGCTELTRMLYFLRAQCSATALVRRRTPPLLAQ